MKQNLSIAARNLEANNEIRCAKYNKNATLKEFELGDRVWLYTLSIQGKQLATKFLPKWTGPYRVIARMGPVNYKIMEIGSRKEQVVHAARLKHWEIPSEQQLEQDTTDEEKQIPLETTDPYNDKDDWFIYPEIPDYDIIPTAQSEIGRAHV